MQEVRTLLKWLIRFARLYWSIRKPQTMGCRAIVTSKDQVLLVRLTYDAGWYLPGGGVKKGESFSEALRRELREECGIEVRNMQILQLYFSTKEGKYDHIALYEVSDFEQNAVVSSSEIRDVQFFSLHDLPPDTSPATRKRLEEYKQRAFLTETW
jgi:ADP-ribose pyrophosphatase YjhB (NUDIX family)